MENANCHGAYVEIKILFFAKSKDLVGQDVGKVHLPIKTTYREILDTINDSFPRIQELGDCFTLSLNEEYLQRDCTVNLSPTDELAIIPPLSGG